MKSVHGASKDSEDVLKEKNIKNIVNLTSVRYNTFCSLRLIENIHTVFSDIHVAPP